MWESEVRIAQFQRCKAQAVCIHSEAPRLKQMRERDTTSRSKPRLLSLLAYQQCSLTYKSLERLSRAVVMPSCARRRPRFVRPKHSASIRTELAYETQLIHTIQERRE